MQILKLEILTNDLEGTEDFYRRVLGTQVIEKTNGSISFTCGLTTLIFKYAANEKPVYHYAFNIPHNKLAEAFDWLHKRVAIMDVMPGDKIADFVNWNAKSFYFYDNNGNILEFIARYELDNRSDDPFGAGSVINISEIGVATEDVINTCDGLINKFGLPVFAKQPRLQNFTALGDHEGLLILSIENRHWYPTDKLAQKFYTRLEVNTNGQIHQLAFHQL